MQVISVQDIEFLPFDDPGQYAFGFSSREIIYMVEITWLALPGLRLPGRLCGLTGGSVHGRSRGGSGAGGGGGGGAAAAQGKH